ncbi:unnamed protein product [Orchesella dallaii]|uniref:Transmembrane protein n=1 Tax=Orchesella dallaii TaxID=48710 RepID=A0ABP1RG52_9HEXA
MCKVICISLKGCCYFAASVHIVDALFMLWTYIFDVINVNKYYWIAFYDDPFITTYLTWLGIYIIVSVILGCLIFRSIETEMPKLMGGAAIAFLVLQIVAFILALIWWYPIPPDQDQFGLLESARISRFVVRCISTLVYILVLGTYMWNILQRDKLVLDQSHWSTSRK